MTLGRRSLVWLFAACMFAGTVQADPHVAASPSVVAFERTTVLATDEWTLHSAATAKDTAETRMDPPPPVAPRHLIAAKRGGPVGGSDDDDLEVDIPDDGLRCAVAEALGEQADDGITRGEMASLTRLELPESSCVELVTSLTGLEHAVNLQSLGLLDNAVTDLAPLAELSRLGALDLGGNPVADAAPIAALTSLEWLRLGRARLADLGPLAQLTRLSTLDVSDNLVTDLAPLAGLVGLKWLAIDGNAVTDLAPLSELAALETLHAGRNRLSDLRPLTGLVRLTTLALDSNAIANLGPLSELAALQNLDLDDNLIKDVRALAGLTNLGRLWLDSNAVTDIGALSGLAGLQTLNLGSNLISDIAAVAGLTELTALSLDDNAIVDLLPLSGLSALTFLDLGENLIEDIAVLASLAELRNLTLDRNAVADLGALSDLTALLRLDLHGNLIEDVAPLAGLTGLWDLRLSDNAVAELAPLARLTALNRLILNYNRVRDLAPLSDMADLLTLAVGYNEVADLGPLSGLTNLFILDLGNNAVSDLGPLAGLTRLGALGFWNNDVSDLGPLSELSGLQWLIAGDNDVSDISAVAGLDRLVVLNVANSSIADIGPVSGLTRLTELVLHGNMVSDIAPLADLPALENVLLSTNPLDAASVARVQVMREAGISVRWDWESPSHHRIWFFPSARDPWRQGFVRLINLSDEDGDVDVVAVDDTGRRHGPLTLSVGANETVHFNSDDLESGNARKGLLGGTGPGEGDWRLEFESDLTVQALAYVRTASGFLASVHNVVPAEANRYHVGVFNPASDLDQASLLRLTNPGAEDAEVTITGVDDRGRSPGTPVRVSVPAGVSVTLDAIELESGIGVEGALGNGAGRWRLALEPTQPIVAASLLSSRASGHLTNLSTLARSADVRHFVPLFPSASDVRGRQGFVRVLNRSDKSGRVRIDARDDTGKRRSVVLAIGAGDAAHFSSADLERGNARRGLSGRTGRGTGAWSLALTSPLDIHVMAFVRTADGFLTSMHDGAPASNIGYVVPTLNPGSNTRRVSTLRLVNTDRRDAVVTIVGIDDRGASPGSEVELTVPGRGALTVSAAELESGAAGPGALGNGRGKWLLSVEPSGEIVLTAMSLLSSPTGHVTNLSTWR